VKIVSVDTASQNPKGIRFGLDVLSLLPIPREPAVTIHGPPQNQIVINEGSTETPAAVFTTVTQDLRGPLTFTWQAPEARVDSPNASGTVIRFPLPLGAQDRDVFPRTVHVDVVDADGCRASTSLPTTIEVRERIGPHDRGH
jgi:hypothetical protein